MTAASPSQSLYEMRHAFHFEEMRWLGWPEQDPIADPIRRAGEKTRLSLLSYICPYT